MSPDQIQKLIPFVIFLPLIGFFLYIAWFSPKAFRAFMDSQKKIGEYLDVDYSKRKYDFWYDPQGISLWIYRILLIPVILLVFVLAIKAVLLR